MDGMISKSEIYLGKIRKLSDGWANWKFFPFDFEVSTRKADIPKSQPGVQIISKIKLEAS